MFNKERFYGRRKGKSLSLSQTELLRSFLPLIHIDDFSSIPVSNYHNEIVLEIGFGNGSHLIENAKSNPSITYIGCEVFLNGISQFINKIHMNKIRNIMIYDNDIHFKIDEIKNDTFDEVRIFFPDPWPKNRHQKRRMINKLFLSKIHRILKQNGHITIATDVLDYKTNIIKDLQKTNFTKKYYEENIPKNKKNKWPITKYEQKACQQNKICYYLKYRTQNK